MSPASQGSLEVERYIGSCLISSSVRNSNTNSSNNNVNHHSKGPRKGTCPSSHHYRQNNYNGVPLSECGANARYGSAGRSWAGMPLISMAPTGSRRNRKASTSTPVGKINKGGSKSVDSEQTRTPLSRLAIHTQGAPLILAGRYNGTTTNSTSTAASMNNNNIGSKGPPAKQYPSRKYNSSTANNTKESVEKSSVPANTSDTLSVASDESSGHSENSLPRIIKPRKRRKKDRKPPPGANLPSNDSTKTINKSEESSNIVTLKPYVPLCYDIYKGNKVSGIPCVVDDERASQTSEEDAQDVKLHHEFDDVEGEDESVALFPYPVCQCRYCDPAGLIWDVDQHCYSPFLTPPSPDAPFFSTPPSSRTFSLFSNNETLPVRLPEKDTCSGLRRSWSDPSPSRSSPICASSQGLEVSTEIVTSPNGHRDIEIKFYSSSPPSVVPAQDNSEKVKFRWGSEQGGLWGTAGDLGEEVKQLRLQVEE